MKGAKSRITTVSRGYAPRSALLVQWGEERIYPFPSQMAKVELKICGLLKEEAKPNNATYIIN